MSHINSLSGSSGPGTSAVVHHRCAVANAPFNPLATGLLTVLLTLAAGPVQAVSITNTYVGTLSSPLTSFGATPGNNPGQVARGNKYVVRTTFETDDIVPVDAALRRFQTRDFHSISLGDAPGGDNTFELFIPSEGFDGILTQTGQDHFVIDSDTAQSAEIHFFNPCNSAASCAAAFRGFEFESNFIVADDPDRPAVGGDIIFELRDPDVSLSGTTVTNRVVNVLDGDPGFALQGIMFNAGTTDVLSESSGPAGGQQNPGVFLREAVPVVAQAGASPLVYSAASLSLTTEGGTELVTETASPITPGQLRTAPSPLDEQPRQADNDLGAGRSDGEDFLSYQWTVGTGNVTGNLPGTRLDRTVATLASGGRNFVNIGPRSVDNVNIQVSLADSGLQNTLDTTTFQVQVTEAITGLSDLDDVLVSYANTGPSATAGGGVVFDAGNFTTTIDASGLADDPDLAANGQVAGFETLSARFSIDGSDIGPVQDLGSPTSAPIPVTQGVTLQDALLGGLDMTTATAILDMEISDLAGATANASQGITYANTLPFIASADHSVNTGLDITFEIDYDDPDLAVNGFLGVDFETLVVEILVDGIDRTGLFGDLIDTGGTSQLVSNADLLTTFGLGSHIFTLNLFDKAMVAGAASPVTASFDFEVQALVVQVPVPATLSLLAFALAGFGLERRRRSEK